MKQASMVGLRESLMLTLHMPASLPGYTGHRPGSSSASGAEGIAQAYADSRYSGRLENDLLPGE